MLIALTLLDEHFDALLLEHNQDTWDIKDHLFLPITALPQLHKKWHQNSQHVVIGLDREQCYYHSFSISQQLSDHALNKYIAINAKKFFNYNSAQLIFDFERYTINHEFDRVSCIASLKKSIRNTAKQFQKINFKITLIDSSVNALIRGFLHQHTPSEQYFGIIEQHQNGRTTYTHSPNTTDTLEKWYCINCTDASNITAEIINHHPGCLTTYGLALNAHLN